MVDDPRYFGDRSDVRDAQSSGQIRKLRWEVVSPSEFRRAVLKCGDSLCSEKISCGQQDHLALPKRYAVVLKPYLADYCC